MQIYLTGAIYFTYIYCILYDKKEYILSITFKLFLTNTKVYAT